MLTGKFLQCFEDYLVNTHSIVPQNFYDGKDAPDKVGYYQAFFDMMGYSVDTVSDVMLYGFQVIDDCHNLLADGHGYDTRMDAFEAGCEKANSIYNEKHG